ncbi:MAG TPA: LysR family transcriptional regulator [Methyloceanibacter sp.]|nr:LysR family transcriptional regulator [Methyloceanibacter sp.]
MDRLAAINVFVAIAEAGSLSAAGRRLGLPLATVSRNLSALEDHVGARLITRTTRRLVLTEPGLQYLESCRRILAELEAAELRLAGDQAEPQGELAFTAPVVFGRLHVLPVVVAFLAAHPRVSARMLLVDRIVDLVEEGLDLSVRVGPLTDSSLIATRVGATRYVACASPGYLAKRGTPSSPRDLTDHDCISFNTLSLAERWRFYGQKRQVVTVQPRLSVNTAEAAIDAAVAGVGITRVMSYQVASRLADGSLRLILEDFEPEEAPVSLLHREDRLPQVKVRSFVAFAAPLLRKALSSSE